MSLFNPTLSARTAGPPAAYPLAGLCPPRAEVHAYGACPNDRDFVALQARLRPSGGLARGDDLALRLGRGQPGGMPAWPA